MDRLSVDDRTTLQRTVDQGGLTATFENVRKIACIEFGPDNADNTTGYSPFYALYGRHPTRPLDFILNTGEEKFESLKEYNESMTKQLKEAWDVMNDNQIQMALQNARNDHQLQNTKFNEGDNVWVWRKSALTR